ncbi:NTP transferase domain-containing protein [Chitinivibrio alkaliphilus]|uniref:MobA-like NTP transferase domain-containing protein n=1 Tax=Chitinivibrio alkaliphilus ACht1 TaxID=1313304 RepID=U7DAR3_9BACT|nr:NTP transferase domain-containing protein [Chitinivibrio alkaliphilus]ERP32217.1 hypothetical protein CALK_0949 [Chitinivibrio alkaliphilus ACht1]
MKILALILAGGKGSRVKHLLSDREKIKPMLTVEGAPLIDHVMNRINPERVDRAVLSFAGDEYAELNHRITEKGIPLLYQKARQRQLPTLLELPYLLYMQYFFSQDKAFLQSYDALLLLPCDILVQPTELESFLSLYETYETPQSKALYLFSKTAGEKEKADLFKVDSSGRILSYGKKRTPRYVPIKREFIFSHDDVFKTLSPSFSGHATYPRGYISLPLVGQTLARRNKYFPFGRPRALPKGKPIPSKNLFFQE